MAIAFVWQPALLAAAEAHERVHALATGEDPHGGHAGHAAAGHATDGVPVSNDHHHDAGGTNGADDGRNGATGNSGGGLHALLHAIHCCGHPSALPALMLAAVLPATVIIPPATVNAGRPGPLLADPLRPPIAG